MIPQAHIQAWRAIAPWPSSSHVEQDLIICRALFDLHQGIEQLALDTDNVIACFEHYLSLEGIAISRAEAEERMLKKLTRSLTEDIEPLLPAGVRFDGAIAIDAFNAVWHTFIGRLRGDAWKLSAEAIEQLRLRFASLLP